MSINVDEVRTELEKYRAEHSNGGQQGARKKIPVEADEIIKLARQTNPPLGHTAISNFLKSRGYNLGHTVVSRRIKELGL